MSFQDLWNRIKGWPVWACAALLMALCWVWFPLDGDSQKKAQPNSEGTQEQDPTPSEFVMPLETFEITSSVAYLSAPDDPHRLQVSIAAPNHARFYLASDPEVQGRRTIHYVTNGKAFATLARSATSAALPDADATSILQWAELRTALFRWAPTDAWQVVDRKAPAGQECLERKSESGHPLRAFRNIEDKVPTRIEILDAQGKVIRALQDIGWSPGAKYISELTVANAAGPVWRETEIRYRPGLFLDPAFFLPVDRRAPSSKPLETLPIEAQRQDSGQE